MLQDDKSVIVVLARTVRRMQYNADAISAWFVALPSNFGLLYLYSYPIFQVPAYRIQNSV